MNVSKKFIDNLNSMEKSPMSRFKDRDIKLFRSHNPQLTAEYHGEMESPGFFEVIMMNWDIGYPQYLIKYPYSDVFVELTSGSSSRNGVHEQINLSNPINDFIDPTYRENVLFPQKIQIYRFGERLMLNIDSRFDFLDQVNFKFDEIRNQEYVNIPDFREIAYAYYSDDIKKYLIVDQSVYKFDYSNMRLFFGESLDKLQIVKMEKFSRFRDGGTTQFSFTYENEKYNFLSPTPFKSEPTKLNDLILSPLTELDKEMVSKELKLLQINKNKPDAITNN